MMMMRAAPRVRTAANHETGRRQEDLGLLTFLEGNEPIG
jgi:hypothetical protein